MLRLGLCAFLCGHSGPVEACVGFIDFTTHMNIVSCRNERFVDGKDLKCEASPQDHGRNPEEFPE